MHIYRDKSLKEYIGDLAAKLAAPGGGSAAALSACLGVSLISKVVNFTLGKPKYTKDQNQLKQILSDSERLRGDFLGLVDLDVEAYQSRNLRDALNVPFLVCRLCFAATKLCPPLIRKGNINLISDVAVATSLLEAAFASAYFNVQINLKGLGDKKLTYRINKELKAKQKKIKRLREETEAKIGKIIRR